MKHRTGGLTAARTRFRVVARSELRIYLEKDEAPPQPSLEELLECESEDEDALLLTDFDDE